MTKTTWIDALRNIKSRFVSWLSIATIVFIGTSEILSLNFAYNSLKFFGNNHIKAHNVKNLDLSCSMGIEEADLEKVLKVEGIKDAEGVVSFDAQVSLQGQSSGATLISMTDRINVPYIVEGALPEAADECAVNPVVAEKMGITPGNTVTIECASSRFSNILVNSEYKVTGIAESPDYMMRGMADYCILPKDAFDTSSSAFDYTNLYISVSACDDLKPTSNEFAKENKKAKADIESILGSLSDAKADAIADRLDEEYEKAQEETNKKLAEAKKEIDSAQSKFNKEIADAKKKLDDAETELNDGKEKVKNELAAAWKKIKDGEAEYNTKIADGEKQLADGEKQLEKELSDAKWLLFDGRLKLEESEKLLNSNEEEYKNACIAYGLNNDKLVEGRKQLDEGWTKYKAGLAELDSKLPPSTVETAAIFIRSMKKSDGDKFDVMADNLIAVKDYAPLERGLAVLKLFDEFDDEFTKSLVSAYMDMDAFRAGVNTLKNGKATLDDGERQYQEGEQQLASAREQIGDFRKQLDQGWYSLEQGEKELVQKQAEFEKKEPEARAQLASKKAEFEKLKADGAKEIADGKAAYSKKSKEANDKIAEAEAEFEEGKQKFEKEKADGEAKLSDARKEYDEAKKDAEDKLAEVKKEIDEAKIVDCRWLVQTINASLYFMTFKAYCEILFKVFAVFTPLFAGVVIVVCFFTMLIVIEEQSKEIGTCKALGMFKKEVRSKYLLFGISAAALGAIAGIFCGYYLETLVLNAVNGVFCFTTGHANVILPVVVVPLGAVLSTGIAVFLSTHNVLSCSAVGLLSGEEPKKKARSKAAKSSRGRVYTRLIVNNLLTDVGRVVVSILIILACTFLIGLTMTIKLSHSGAINSQAHNICAYDLDITLSDSATDEEKAEFLKEISGYDSVSLYKFGGVLQSDVSQTVTQVYCVEDDRFTEFYVCRDQKGNPVKIPEDGALTTFEMEDKNGLSDGKVVTITGADLRMGDVTINGHYLLHVGKAVIMSFDYFREVYGTEPVINDYMIKLGGEDIDEVTERFKKLSGVARISRADDVIKEKASTAELYTAIVYVVITFSILLSFMILLNLSNILVKHRMRELLTMRINGFSKAEVVGYLVREVLITVSFGVVLGVVSGIPFTLIILRNVEADSFMFLRRTFALAWVVAAGSNILFSLVINTISFSKVGKIPLTDITKY